MSSCWLITLRRCKGRTCLEGGDTTKTSSAVAINYIARTKIESLIMQKLLSGGMTQPRCVLHGIGGAGKTQLATNWIKRNESRFTHVVVVDGSSRDRLKADLERWIRSIRPDYSKMSRKDAKDHLIFKEK